MSPPHPASVGTLPNVLTADGRDGVFGETHSGGCPPAEGTQLASPALPHQEGVVSHRWCPRRPPSGGWDSKRGLDSIEVLAAFSNWSERWKKDVDDGNTAGGIYLQKQAFPIMPRVLPGITSILRL